MRRQRTSTQGARRPAPVLNIGCSAMPAFSARPLAHPLSRRPGEHRAHRARSTHVAVGPLSALGRTRSCHVTNCRLGELVAKDPVMLFMKGTAEEPRCGFSRKAVAMLQEAGVAFGTFDILSDEEVRQGLKEFSNWPTYPQLYAKGAPQPRPPPTSFPPPSSFRCGRRPPRASTKTRAPAAFKIRALLRRQSSAAAPSLATPGPSLRSQCGVPLRHTCRQTARGPRHHGGAGGRRRAAR